MAVSSQLRMTLSAAASPMVTSGMLVRPSPCSTPVDTWCSPSRKILPAMTRVTAAAPGARYNTSTTGSANTASITASGIVVKQASRIAKPVRCNIVGLSSKALDCEIAGTRLTASEAVTIVARLTSGTAMPVR